MKRWLVGILLIITFLFGIASADDYNADVANYNELASAFGYANDHPGTHVIVNITENFTMSSGVGIHGENVELTLFGNEHTLDMNGCTIGARDGAHLNLGTEDGGKKNILTLDANNIMNLNAIVAISETSSSSTITTLNMYEGVTLMNNTVQGYGNSGRGVHMLGGIFNMYGGTIKNNSAGTSQNGGAVCVSNDRGAGNIATYIAEFNMYGGSLESNEAYYGGAVYLLNGTTFNMYGGEIHGNTAFYGGGAIFLTAKDKVNLYGGVIYENAANVAGGGAYVSNNAILTIAGGEVQGNSAQQMGGGIYTEQGNPGGTLIMTDGSIYNNTAGSNGADITNRGKLSLSSASSMNKEFHDSGFLIDAWYYDIDYSSYGIYRWDLAQAFEGDSSKNYYIGDTIPDESGLVPLIAAFTAHDRITVSKNWEDYDNQYNTRPDEVTVTLKDTSGDTVKLMTLDGSTGADATVTLTKENNWTATIAPLAIADYSTGYTLSEDDVAGYNTSEIVIGNKTNDVINEISYNSGKYTTSFTNTYRRPITIYKFWDDSNNKDEARPTDTEKMKISVLLGNTAVTDADGNLLENITLTRYDTTGRDDDHPIGKEMAADDPTSATEIWATTVYVEAPADFESLVFKETTTPDEYYANGGSIAYGEGGAMTRIMINKHDLRPLSDYVTNENMVEIHFQVDKVWTGDKDWDRPMPKIFAILKANGEQIGKEEIKAVTDETTGDITYSAVFHNVPKYVDNENDDLVYYSIEEIIDDPMWINGGQTIDAAGNVTYEWYYMTGEGKYKVTIETVQPTLETGSLEVVTGSKITNDYELFQKTTTVDVTKLWKDHRNESGARPDYLKLGLFDTDGNLVAEVVLSGSSTEDSWSGTFEGYTNSEGTFIPLPLYNEDGSYVDYSHHIVKEKYSVSVSTSDSGEAVITWSDGWKESGDEYILTVDGNEYKYTYNDRGSDVINLDITRNLGQYAPAYSSLIGLFENESDTEPVRTAYLTSETGSVGERIISELDAYDAEGNEINYTGYVIKESPDEGKTWNTVDASIVKDGTSYVFSFPNSATINVNAATVWNTDSTYLKVALFDSNGNQVGNATTLSGPEGKLTGLSVYGSDSNAIDYVSGYTVKYASPAATAADGSVTEWSDWSTGNSITIAEGTYQYTSEIK